MSRTSFGRTLILLPASPALLATAVQAQITWYVDDDAANDPGPGDPTVSDPLEDGTAEHPFDAIQEGIDAANDGDEVLVADGSCADDGNFLPLPDWKPGAAPSPDWPSRIHLPREVAQHVSA